MHQQFAHNTPDPNIAIDTLTDLERYKFNFLLNWAHAVYTSRVSHYNEQWTHACNHQAPTPWLDHAIIIDNSQPPNLAAWREPRHIPDVDWAAWITWTEHRQPSTCPHLSASPSNSFAHDYQPILDPVRSIPSPYPLTDMIPIRFHCPAFTAAYSLYTLPFSAWLARRHNPNQPQPSLESHPVTFTFSIPNSTLPTVVSGTIPTIRHYHNDAEACQIAILFDTAIANLSPPPNPPLTDDHLSYLWYSYALTSDDNKRLFCASYAAAISNCTPLSITNPTSPPSFQHVRLGYLFLQWTGDTILNARDGLCAFLHNPPHLLRLLPIPQFAARYDLARSFSAVLLGHYKPDLSQHAHNAAFICAFCGHFQAALSVDPLS